MTIRNSFHRFDDDLCEVILSYLPLSDCFEYECVSKQWKRLIFNKQNKLVIGSEDIRLVDNNLAVCLLNLHFSDESLLKSVLRKCRFVSDLNIDCWILNANDRIMDIISYYCQYLKSFRVKVDIDRVSHNCLNRFASKFGQTLEMIDINCTYYRFKLLIDLIPNLRIIRFATVKEMSGLDSSAPSISSIFITSDNKPVLPKLVQIDLSAFVYLNGFELFVDIYCKQIKRLRILFVGKFQLLCGRSALTRILYQINRFGNLEKLDLDFDDFDDVFQFVESLANDFRLIGQKCVKLTELRIEGLNSNLVNYFDNFVLLRKLEIIYCEHNFDSDLRFSQCFKSFTHLTHLSVMCHTLVDKNFDEIGLYLPKLKYLCISGDNKCLTDNTLRNLLEVKQLCCLKLIAIIYDRYYEVYSQITDAGICDVIRNCLRINSIEIGIITRVTQRSMNTFMEKAKQFPKMQFSYSIRVTRDLPITVESLPTNMRVKVIG